jgi:hypothetical protein
MTTYGNSAPSLPSPPAASADYNGSTNLDPRSPPAVILPMEQTYRCACCAEQNETCIDPQAGQEQQFVEDCRVCCRPNVITARFNTYKESYDIDTYLEDRD